MSARKNNSSTVVKVCIDAGVNILILLLLMLVITVMVNGEAIKTDFLPVAIMMSVVVSCAITSAVMKKEALTALISGAILMLIILLFAFSQKGSGAEPAALLKCAACIAAGKAIPFVIKRRGGVKNRHKSKRR